MTDTRAAAGAPVDRGRRLARRQGAPRGGADAPRRENEALRGHDALRRENEALRRRAARLSAAVRRIGASLDAGGARARRDGGSRAELLGAAGRRLLTPLTSIKGSTATALEAPAALDRSGMLQLVRIIDEQADRMADLAGGGPEAHAIGAANGGIGERLEAHAIGAANGGIGERPEAHANEAGSGGDGAGSWPRLAHPAGGDRGAGGGRATGGPAAPRQPGQAPLTGRAQAVPRPPAGLDPFRLGDLAVDHERRRVTVAGRRVDLTATEYELLRALSANAGGVSTADALLRRVWGGRRAGDPNLLRTFVKRLRGKLGDDPGRPAYIFTERGVGYRLAAPGDGPR